jgi:hypothetical protein
MEIISALEGASVVAISNSRELLENAHTARIYSLDSYSNYWAGNSMTIILSVFLM